MHTYIHTYILGQGIHTHSLATQLGYDYHNLTSINRTIIHSKLGEGREGVVVVVMVVMMVVMVVVAVARCDCGDAVSGMIVLMVVVTRTEMIIIMV